MTLRNRLFNYRWSALMALALAVALVVACGGSNANTTKSTGGQNGGAAGDGSASNSAAIAQVQSGDAGQQAPASTTGATTASTDPNVANLPSELDRKIVRVATLTLTADNIAARFQDASNIASLVGGFVSNSTFGNSGDQQTASVTIRVPSERYQDALVQLRKLGDVKDESSNANDVTEEYTDLGSRLRNLQATEEQYLGFLKQAGNLTDVLTVQDRLNQTRGQIEQVQGRINLLDNQTNLATITVHFEPPAIAKADQTKQTSSGPFHTAKRAFDASIIVLVGLATAILAVGAFSWWLVPLAVAGWFLGRRSLRESRARRPPSPPTV